MTNKLLAGLQDYALSVFRCGPVSIHGPVHWRNVDEAGMLICRESTADLLVVRFFAYLHDARRHDDGADLEHGPRSAARLGELPEHLDVLSAEQKELLAFAICHHTDGDTTDGSTVGACWDGDRLDLGRVGIIPSAKYMSTQPGKDIADLGKQTAVYGQVSRAEPPQHCLRARLYTTRSESTGNPRAVNATSPCAALARPQTASTAEV